MKPIFGSVIALGLIVSLAATQDVSAQDEGYKRRQSNLVALSTVFGRLHHLRRLCVSRREDQLWRDHMKQVIELEDPVSQTRAAMIDGFNAGFNSAQRNYDRCTRQVEELAAEEAIRGEAVAASLQAPLFRSQTRFPDQFSDGIPDRSEFQ